MNYESVIILGYKRSGTSLLRVILNSHPDIAIGPEVKFMQKAVKRYPKTFEEFKKLSQQSAADFKYDDDTLLKIYNSSSGPGELMKNWCMAYKNITGKKIWGDKTPQNFKYLKMLSKKFPNSLYIHIVRHPFDVIKSSMKRGQYNGVQTILAWFVSNMNVRFVKKKNYYFFRYEDFVKDTSKYIDHILEELGVEKIDLLSIYQDKDHGRIAEGDSWNKPIFNDNRSNKNQKLSFKDKFLVKLICFPYLKKYGYKS
jgi:hypothetical protein